ncbi:MAG: hypothetical protein ACYTGN_17525 [Planctomycetota bacterium]|jgi:hypothetical protein
MSTTEGKIVVCPQCGKKYKLKAGFDAASFSCNACSATVWVKEKRSSSGPVTSKRRPSGGGRAGAKAGGGGRAAKGGGRGRGRQKVDVKAGHIHDHARYSKKDNSTTIFFAAIGVIALGAGVFFLVGGGDDPPPPATGTTMADSDSSGTGTKDRSGGDPAMKSTAKKDATDPGSTGGTGSKPGTSAKAGGGSDTDGASTDEPMVKEAEAKPSKKLGNTKKSKKGKKGKSKWDPPVDLAHLEDTPPEMRKKIDDLIKLMFDPFAGRDSLDAKEQLVAIGKPAFPRVLGAMAKVRDTITDVDNDDERLIESSLKLADAVLREMDGWLTAKGKSDLRPGSEKRYIAYICRLHYKRWVQVLSKMPEMPGPYDPSGEYKGEAEEYR